MYFDNRRSNYFTTHALEKYQTLTLFKMSIISHASLLLTEADVESLCSVPPSKLNRSETEIFSRSLIEKV
jgi:hypothetical protein